MTKRSARRAASGTPLAEALKAQGILPGIKVDTGAKPLAGFPDETVTEGLDGLRDRLREYHGMGARFAKWRAVIHVTDTLPSSACVSANAHALARYASLCQEQDLVPIVEPEVLMDGSHSIERCEEVTGMVLHAFSMPLRARCRARRNAAQAQHGSRRQGVRPPGLRGGGRDRDTTLLAPARAGRGAWHRVPVGRSTARLATAHLNAINRLPGPKPWKISFSYGRALQDPALEAWHGRDENLQAGQQALYRRARSNGAASSGSTPDEMEAASPSVDDPPHRRDWRDD